MAISNATQRQMDFISQWNTIMLDVIDQHDTIINQRSFDRAAAWERAYEQEQDMLLELYDAGPVHLTGNQEQCDICDCIFLPYDEPTDANKFLVLCEHCQQETTTY